MASLLYKIVSRDPSGKKGVRHWQSAAHPRACEVLVGSSGSAAIPTPALDPPHGAASPAVPALIGSGSPSCRLLQICDFLKFGKQVGMKLRQMPHHAGIVQQAGDVASGENEIEMIGAIGLLDQLKLSIEAG